MMEADYQSQKDSQSDQIIFRSRYSILLLLIILTTIIILAYAGYKEPKALIGFIIAFPIIIMVLGFQYGIKDDTLLFKIWGIKSGSVPIESILKVERSYLVLSSNAGSFKRLYITLKKGSKYPFILISPIREAEFIDCLKRINPQIIINVESKSGMFRFWDWDL
jgi:hypothetical protein